MTVAKYPPRAGWWFSGENKLPHGDGRPIVIGERLGVKGRLAICKNALHGSFDPFDALQYAPGPLLHRCVFSGARIEENDKLGSRYRTVTATRDATAMLRLFAREQALSVIHLWDAPTIVREYLETGDETKRDAARAARGAARAAAWDAAWDAARAAAEDAAWAAGDAAWAAARAAARGAARAAGAAAEDAAWAAGAAARAAARAAGAAAEDASRKRFNELVMELFEAQP